MYYIHRFNTNGKTCNKFTYTKGDGLTRLLWERYEARHGKYCAFRFCAEKIIMLCICRSIHKASILLQQECIPVGCVPPAAWLYLGVSTFWGEVGGGGLGSHRLPSGRGGSAPPWHCKKAGPREQADSCENITFPQPRLRAVKIRTV